MHQFSEIFEQHYNDYCAQIAKVDFGSVTDRLGIRKYGNQIQLSFFNKDYVVSNNGIVDEAGNRPEYMACVIIAKYILLCPDQSYHDTEWVSFKDFKRTSHFTNVNFFTSDTERTIAKHFSGKLDEFSKAGEQLGGIHHEMETNYDLSIQFSALPRISLLLLFNNGDEEFPAQCTVLFQKHAEFYLDPESLIMTGAFLARNLKICAKKH
ncbi:MAG: DUF3786 domain-containing protein [Desulfatirhabdiaceae bacterium]